MLAFVALGVAVVVLIVVNEWSIRSVRASRRRELAASIRRLELVLDLREPEPNPFEMTNEPGQMIPVWGPSPGERAVGRWLKESDPPPMNAAIPQWYDEYRKKMANPRLYVDDSTDLEVW